MNKKNAPSLFNIWTIMGALAIAGLLLLLTLISIGWTNPHLSSNVGFVPADLTIIPRFTATVNAPPTATLDPLLAGTPTPPQDQIGVNGFVQIHGTEGDGLRIRKSPGLNSETVFRGEEGEVFQVRDGPQQVDGYTWWYLVAPYDDTRSGWAASDFLLQVPSP